MQVPIAWEGLLAVQPGLLQDVRGRAALEAAVRRRLHAAHFAGGDKIEAAPAGATKRIREYPPSREFIMARMRSEWGPWRLGRRSREWEVGCTGAGAQAQGPQGLVGYDYSSQALIDCSAALEHCLHAQPGGHLAVAASRLACWCPVIHPMPVWTAAQNG